MASLVLGVGTPHTPQLSLPWTRWGVLQEKDQTDPRLDYADLLARARPGIEQELTPEVWQRRSAKAHGALAILRTALLSADLDLLVVLGDDQHEQFQDSNMPVFCVYRGASVSLAKLRHSMAGPWADAPWQRAEEDGLPDHLVEYPAAPAFADHLIRSLIDDCFDVASSSYLREDRGLGHAFTFLYRKRLLPREDLPLLPVMLNAFYPPNQPAPARCYEFGQAVARAIQRWPGAGRVGIVASGGLSHTILDEELDRTVVDALRRKDRDALCALPASRLTLGTSEIRNWITLAGAVEELKLDYVAYEPCYRSPAATGCGMAFATWS